MATDYKTIRVPQDVYEQAKERKEAHGVTWGEYLNPHAWHSVFDNPDTDLDAGGDIDTDAIAENVAEELEASKADIDRVLNRLDDLETTLPRKIAEELQR